MSRRIVLRFLIAVIGLTVPAIAQAPTELVGRWICTDEDNRGEQITIEHDAFVVDGQRLPLQLHGPGVLLIGGEDGARMEFRVEGATLTLTIDGESMTFRRGGDASSPPPAEGGNPLAGAPPAGDAFARPFRGDDIALDLQGTPEAGYRGTLAFRGMSYLAEAGATDGVLRGRFQVGEQWFDFTATLDGDRLELASGGATYRLVGEPMRAARPGNPLAGPDAPGASEASEPPPALTGVFEGNASRYEHPRGWFSFDMPERWSVHQQGDAGMLVNPGLTANDSLDALVFLTWGRLDPADQNLPVARVIEKHLPEMREVLAQQGLAVGEPEGPVATVQGKDIPGGVVTFRGRSQQGQDVRAWFGGIVKRDSWISVGGVMLTEKEADYLPKLKRIFASLDPKPPERNQALEAALVGKTFSSSQYGRVTQSAHHASYSFAAGGAVTRRLMSNVIGTPGSPGISTDSERGGGYEVCGDVLYLYFDTGQEVGQVLQQDGQVTGIRIGNAEYR